MKKLILPFVFATALLAASAGVDVFTQKDIKATQQELAQKAGGPVSKELTRYGNHYTMVAYRDKTGMAEVHDHEADFFVVQSGTATLVTGGKVVSPHPDKPGEIRGTSIEGGKRQTIAAGDVVHIPAGLPHILLIDKPFTYFVIKVTGQ